MAMASDPTAAEANSAEAGSGDQHQPEEAATKQNGEATDLPEPFLRFRLTYLDTVQSTLFSLPPPPTATDKSTPFIPARRIPFAPAGSNLQVDRIPELRIFGATEAGQRCCIHVHGALPYVYVEYEGKVAPEEVQTYINRLARAINVCMAASLGRKDPTKSLFVAFVVPVKGVPFYGFHVGYRYFLKIYSLDPKFTTRMVTLLRSGEIMKKRFIVYEAHIPFHLQFMLDFNLYGCGWVDISKAKFREPVPEAAEDSASNETGDRENSSHDFPKGAQYGSSGQSAFKRIRKPKRYTRSTIPASMLYTRATDSPSRVAHSELEFDIHVSWILNRHLVKERNIHADFTEYLTHPIPDDFKFVHSVRELWEDEKRRRQMKGIEGPFEVSENSAEELLGGLSAGTRSGQDDRMYGIGTQPPWMAHNQNIEQFHKLVENDTLEFAARHPANPVPSFETFVKGEKKGGWMEKIRTTFKSVEALFEETMVQNEADCNPFGAWAVRGIGVQVATDGQAARQMSTGLDDVNPQYLAMLATQAGRARLAQMEAEDETLQADQTEALDASGIDQDVVAPSDEEEGQDQDVRRQVEERAKKIATKQKLKRTDALIEAEDVQEEEERFPELASEDYGGLVPPMAAQGAATRRGSSLSDRMSRSDSRDSTSTKHSDERVGSSEDQSSGPSEGVSGREIRPAEDQDPDVMLLDQLLPLDSDASSDTAGIVKEECAYFSAGDEEAMLDNSPPTPTAQTHNFGQEPADPVNIDSKSQNKADLLRAGLENLSQLDLGSSAYASSSPLRDARVESTQGHAITPRSKTPFVFPQATPFGRKQPSTTPSPNKKSAISPSKTNYFSPAKSKLRNAIVNPTFVGEAKLKRKREDELIGFRAIGDHGRTTLQRMLDVQRQPRPKRKAALEAGKPLTLGTTLAMSAGTTEQNRLAQKRQRTSSFSSEMPDSSSDEEMPGMAAPMHVLLSSADAESTSVPGKIDETFFSAPVYPTLTQTVPSALANEDDHANQADTIAGTDFEAFDEIPYTPTQIIRTQFDMSHTEEDTLPSATISGEDYPLNEEEVLPARSRRGVRFRSELEVRCTSPISDACEQIYDSGDVEGDDLGPHPNGSASDAPMNLVCRSTPGAMQECVSVSVQTSSQRGPTSGEPTSRFSGGMQLLYVKPAPMLFELLRDLDSKQLPHILYRDPYWSNFSDVPQHAFEYAGRRYTHQGDANKHLQPFETASASYRYTKPLRMEVKPTLGVRKWEYAEAPPTVRQLAAAFTNCSDSQAGIARSIPTERFAKSKNRILDTQWQERSQIQGPTQANPFGAKYAQVKPSNAVVKEKEHMSALAIELHVNTRGELLPDPSQDPIHAIFYCLQHEADDIPNNGRKEGQFCGFIAVQTPEDVTKGVDLRKLGLSRYPVEIVEDEIDLVKALVDKVHEWDPEIFTGYDVLKDSWGYFVERVDEIAPEFDIVMELSRVKTQSTGKRGSKSEDRWGYSKGATLKVTGRHILPVWRLLKSDVNLCIYSLENVVFHVLRRRIPRFSHRTLTEWFTSGQPRLVVRALQYHILRAQLVIDLLEEAEIVSRNAEFARVFGVDFYSVLTRGSQFKVESVMFKITKPENFMLPSPSREDVGKQNAAECIPLILEPQSGFYSSPVLVFDFQSLYPSVMIAYNLCYSTCLGRLKEFMGTNRLGTSSLAVPPGCLTLLKDLVTLSPNGLMFLKPQVRRSMLSKMLTEILDTRVMVKKSMKLVDEVDRALVKLLNARQLGLKFIANVTYGYTSATFSGRMPCVEIADAIVQTGRETLERAKNTIQSRPDWGAIVRYGDTDSLFVHLPGKTKDEAFNIGNEIADTITRMNPKPVKLKFEKVYLPCFLLAKKRYVGFKFEAPKDEEPEFDAKGIETVRRDGFPAMQKILETSIKTADLSQVKHYVQQQYVRIMQNRSSPQDFIYAKEVKMGSYSDKVTPPPGAVVTARRMLVDPRTEALYGERVPYIITRGIDGPKAKQAARALTPEEFLVDSENALDDLHYIGRIVKTLNRLFNLVGVDTQEWWNSTPRRKMLGKANKQDKTGRIRVDQHFSSLSCPICGSRKPTSVLVCFECASDGMGTNLVVIQRSKQLEQREHDVRAVCATCASLPVGDTDACESVDCPVLYSRVKAVREHATTVELFEKLKISLPGHRTHQEAAYLVV